jgi:hypothetical protein
MITSGPTLPTREARQLFSKGPPMQAEALAALCAVMRGVRFARAAAGRSPRERIGSTFNRFCVLQSAFRANAQGRSTVVREPAQSVLY